MLSENEKSIFSLMLSDSSLPIGGFAFSNGLESLARMGFFNSYQDFHDYIKVFSTQITDFDAPYMNSCFQMDSTKTDDQLLELSNRYHAMVPVPAIRRSSLVQGTNFLRLANTLHPVLQNSVKVNWYKKNLPLSHFCLTWSVCLEQLNFTLPEIIRLYLYKAVRDQTNAAIRLALLSPTDAMVLQNSMIDYCVQLIENSRNKTYLQAHKTSVLMDVAQGYHRNLYVKLFQS
ncbi:MAG: hypothetical protein IID32_07350 [Planctomycetes bacterium]|nr:hypothetical protein [Planctomycetota bacterium]